MLITLTRGPLDAGEPLTIGVSEDRMDDVVQAMSRDGWHVVNKVYWPSLQVVDSLQIALLEVSALPPGAPMRIAVEAGASAAVFSAPRTSQEPAAHAALPAGADSSAGDSTTLEPERRRALVSSRNELHLVQTRREAVCEDEEGR